MKDKWFIVLAVVLLFFGCKKNRLDVNVSGIKAKVQIHRYDSAFFGQDTSTLYSSLDNIRNIDSSYFDIYTGEILRIGLLSDEGFKGYLNQFINDTVYRTVADSVLVLFSDLSKTEKLISDGFQYYLYHFPGAKIPKIYTQVSGFNRSIVVSDSAIGISLDQYMGAKCIFYQYLGIHQYKRETMYPTKMVADLFYALGTSLYSYKATSNNLLSNMMYQGKLLYFTEAMCRTLPDTVLIGYSQNQINWCKANESTMWSYLVEHKMLFSSERMLIRKFLGEAPHTTDFTSESPGRAGSWLGWQIIRSYMNKNKEVTLPQLMEMNDYQEILSNSAYYPD